MKQIIIGKNKPYASGVDYTDLTQVPEGVLALFNLSDGSLISTRDGMTGSFAVVLGRGENKMPLHFPEVNMRTLTVEKAVYAAGKTFTASVEVEEVEKGKTYTVCLYKCGTVFNERNRWSFSVMAKNDKAEDVVEALAKQINNNTASAEITAEAEGTTLKVTAVKEGVNYTFAGADELMGIEVTDVTEGVPAILDKAYVQDLASRCAAGKGFNYLGDDGAEIYPGYPETVEDTKYVMFTLRFAVPRVAAKQRDEVVYQILHIVLPQEAQAVNNLNDIFDQWSKMLLNMEGCNNPDCPNMKGDSSSSDKKEEDSTPSTGTVGSNGEYYDTDELSLDSISNNPLVNKLKLNL